MPPEKAIDGELIRRRPFLDWSKIALNLLLPVAGVLVALLIGGIMLLVLKANPIAAYSAMLSGAVGSVSGVTQSLVKATPLLLV